MLVDLVLGRLVLGRLVLGRLVLGDLVLEDLVLEDQGRSVVQTIGVVREAVDNPGQWREDRGTRFLKQMLRNSSPHGRKHR